MISFNAHFCPHCRAALSGLAGEPAQRQPMAATQQTASAASTERGPGSLAPEEPFTAEFFRALEDPAGFMRARLEAIDRPTSAVVRSAFGGEPQPVNPRWLATLEQAQMMAARLRELGIPADEIEEMGFAAGPFYYDYGDDPRRQYVVGGMSVGALLRLYAVYPKEVADRMVLDEWRLVYGS